MSPESMKVSKYENVTLFRQQKCDLECTWARTLSLQKKPVGLQSSQEEAHLKGKPTSLLCKSYLERKPMGFAFPCIIIIILIRLILCFSWVLLEI